MWGGNNRHLVGNRRHFEPRIDDHSKNEKYQYKEWQLKESIIDHRKTEIEQQKAYQNQH